MYFIGEAIDTAAISVLLKNLASTKLLRFASQENIHADLKMWEKRLENIKAVLDDAEEKQITNSFVKEWVDELKDAAYQAEDLLDEIATDASRYKLEAELKSKVQLFNLTYHTKNMKNVLPFISF